MEEFICCVIPEDCYDENLLFEYSECLLEDECSIFDPSCYGGSSGAAGIMAEGAPKLAYAVGATLSATAVCAAEYLL